MPTKYPCRCAGGGLGRVKSIVNVMKQTLLSALIVALAVGSSPVLADDDDYRARLLWPAALDAVLMGYQSYRNGDYAAALAVWGPYVDRAPHRVQYLYAKLLAEGQLGEPDPKLASELVKESAIHGHPEGQYLLALSLRAMGEIDLSIQWLNVAAQSDWPDAHYALGQLYEAGEGLDANFVEAIFHYEKATSLGHALSIARSENLLLRMSPKDIELAKKRLGQQSN